MSREVDLTQPLSEEDKEYLRARGREQQVTLNEAQFSDDPAVQAAAAFVPGLDVDLAEGVPATPGGDPRVVMGGGPVEGPVTFDTEDNYEAWSKSELEEELENRDLPKSGNKTELVARLREDDASDDSVDQGDEDDE